MRGGKLFIKGRKQKRTLKVHWSSMGRGSAEKRGIEEGSGDGPLARNSYYDRLGYMGDFS